MNIATRPRAKNADVELSNLAWRRLAELRMLRDDIRVRLNLAGKDARQHWRDLETRVRAAEADVRAARRKRMQTLATLVEDVRRFRNRLLEKAAPIYRIC